MEILINHHLEGNARGSARCRGICLDFNTSISIRGPVSTIINFGGFIPRFLDPIVLLSFVTLVLGWGIYRRCVGLLAMGCAIELG